ncbi:tyrosine decarboxylase MnfA [Candidatus Methanoperedens nitroreducens]|uniref:Probable L-tyrosine/L-aspartate decarboxylase n=1 Tax=Candidatus Methanoperedens nitratireducens TaxID=1392998 RepID=A0A062V6V5_9EURY|nr:tyrosine decarboxylase MfnA [Candidatus Methanoperedens nitroreducens]KCZ72313.1 tyrosine decarboxylase MnfA [Candidatus Methanoperedens nitroreducens]MDJ1420778.1 tyrosine decarboxylase MfnA [Candidatus Methanoperedens sp.]
MNQKGLTPGEVLSLLDNAGLKNTPYEKVLSAMCTKPHPIALKAHMQFIESNLGDSGLFTGTKELEEKVINIMGDLMGDSQACGYITTGGTESNIQAIRTARNLAKKKHPNIVVPVSAHFSFDKIADLLGIEIRKAGLDNQFRVDTDSVENLIDDNTIALVGIAGSTEFGQIDPIDRLARIALSNDLFLHIDAAFGGFVIPFLDKKYDFDFSIKGVSSITIDPHKMGLSTIPAGGLLFKEESYLFPLEIDTPYLTIRKQRSLAGTRSGAAVAAAYAVMMHLGREGYKRIVDRCIKMTDTIVDGVRECGVQPLIDPVMNIIALDVPDLDEVRKKLRAKGWFTSITRDPSAMRLVIMPHLSEEILELFISDITSEISTLS